MLEQLPRTRSELLRALSRASFRTFSIADIHTKEQVHEVSKTLTKLALAKKTACVVILLDAN